MLIIFNPAAGRRRAQRLWRVLDIMAASGLRLEIAETQFPGHATHLAREAARAGHDLVVAAGGDGTIADVANGLAGAACRLGVIPLGSANVLAHELGLPFQPHAVAAALAFGRTRPVWPGMVAQGDVTNGMVHANGGSARLFVQMVGAGFDAQVVHQVGPFLKRTLGRSAYVAQGLREIIRYRFRPILARIDDQETEAASIIVTKGRLYGGSYRLAPGATPMAPGFTVALFDRSGPMAALLYGAALPLNLVPDMPGLRLVRARQVAIVSPVPAQADGDAAGRAPLLVTDAPRPIQMVVEVSRPAE